MTQDRRKPLDLQESSELVPVRQENGAYSFVHPRRARKGAVASATQEPAPAKDAAMPEELAHCPRGTAPSGVIQEAVSRLLAEEFDEDDLRPTRRFTPASIAPLVDALPPTAALPAADAREAYPDPQLCSCDRMMAALASKVVMVVVAGPVTLSPAFMREEALLKGAFAVDRLDAAYDGKPWAFRHCPFEGSLIDPQVAILPQTEPMTCCGTMALAVAHGRVELPEPVRYDRVSARFTAHDGPSVVFSRCPWCATEMIDLVLARYKRNRGL